MLKRITFLLLATAAPAAVATEPPPPPSGPAGGGKVYLTTQEALALAFPKCTVKRAVHYLDAKEKARVGKLAGAEQTSAMVVGYAGRRKSDGGLVGTVYFDRHKVRSKTETLMVLVAPDETVTRIEILSFSEPEDYLPQARWLDQFDGRKLDDGLKIKGGIRGITGATLTARAVTRAVRLVLARHQVVAGSGS